MKILVVVLVSFIIASCASITETKNQSVSVNTGDVTGATCTLSNSKGSFYIPSTPGTVTVRQACDPLTIVCKKDGYVPADPNAGTVQDKSKGMTWGNIIFGGIVGVAVDRSTGAGCTYPQQTLFYPLKKA